MEETVGNTLWYPGNCLGKRALPPAVFRRYCHIRVANPVSAMATASNTRAFNAIFNELVSSARTVETLSSAGYYKNKLSIFDFLKGLREKGNFVSTLGLNSADNGGTVRLSEGGRATIWFSWDDKEASVTVSKALSQRMVELCAGTDFRSMPNGGVEALRACYPLLTKAFVGQHKQTGATMVAV